MRRLVALVLSLLALAASPAAAQSLSLGEFDDLELAAPAARESAPAPSLAEQLLGAYASQDVQPFFDPVWDVQPVLADRNALPAIEALALELDQPLLAALDREPVIQAETEERPVQLAMAGSERFLAVAPTRMPSGIARFGPFVVLDGKRAALVGVTDSFSPRQFEAMIRAFPSIAVLEMIECPGTEDDRANLRVGRMIHDRGIATHVPAGGSVRSGAVELFLAGRLRGAEQGAQFAVHSWEDNYGREAKDYADDAPENRAYVDYYREMGMDEARARGFYAMTNSVPFSQALYFGREEMARWVALN